MSRGPRIAPSVLVVAGLMVAVGLALLWRGPGLGSDRHVAQAREALAQGQLEAAQRHARAALAAAPVDSEPLVVLAQVAEAAEDLETAERLHVEAARRSQRAITSHGWLAARLGARGEIEPALAHVDALLRSHVNLRDELYPALVSLLDSPRGVQALADRLGQEPRWRTPLLRHIGRHAGATDSLSALFVALDAGPGPATVEERGFLLQRLVDEGRFRQAWLMFVATLDAQGLTELGNLFNGGFERDSSGLPFDWQFGRVAGAVIEQVESIDDDGARSRRLRIEFLNRRVPFNHVSQLLVLDPGRYRLEGRVRLESLANPRGLQWVVHCAPSRSTELVRSERFYGTRAWGRFGDEFTVPAEGCEAQWLRLQIPARIDSERQVSGRAWFDDMAIRRVPDGT